MEQKPDLNSNLSTKTVNQILSIFFLVFCSLYTFSRYLDFDL